jgi:hypothetical protein
MLLNKLSKIISILTHPLILLNLGLFSILKFHPYYFSKFYDEQFYTLSVFISINTLLMPILFFYLFVKFRFISDYSLSNPSQRLVPYLIVSGLLTYTAYQLYKNDFSGLPVWFLIATILCILLNVLINIKFTISSHGIGGGGLIGLYLYLTAIQNTHEFIWFLILSFILAGLAGWARLKANAHNELQLYSGYALGFVVTFVMLLVTG